MKFASICLFQINITKLPFSYNPGFEERILQALQSENILELQPSNTRSFQYPALPNRRHVIEITAHKTKGEKLKFSPVGNCSIPPEGEISFYSSSCLILLVV